MKTIYITLVSFTCCFYTFSQQQFYVCASAGRLMKLNATTCDSTFIGVDSTNTVGCGSIAMTSDHKLYGLGCPYLFEIDTSNAQVTIISSNVSGGLSGANNLVADSAGNLLSVGVNDSLYQINRFTGQSFSLGYVGYSSAGDLTFYNDTLYLAAGDSCCTILVKIILSPFSAYVVGVMSSSLAIFGINTVCINNVETMIASGGGGLNSYSNIYKVNPANASLTL